MLWIIFELYTLMIENDLQVQNEFDKSKYFKFILHLETNYKKIEIKLW